MGVVEFFIIVVLVVLLGWLAVYAIGTLAPGHPTQVDTIIWFVVVLIVLVTLANAMGILGRDPIIPRLR